MEGHILDLLKERFPDNPLLATCSNLINEFFCARIVDNHSYAGRLFFTDKFLFFVSTMSEAMSHDISLNMDEITEIIVYHQIIPSVKITLKEQKEEFTNFHDINKIITSLKTLLPNVSLDVKRHSLFSKYNRLTSLPSAKHQTPMEGSVHLSTKLLNICPYFSQSGYCPRVAHCKLDHVINSSIPKSSSTEGSKTPPKMAEHEISRSISLPVRAFNKDTEKSMPLSCEKLKESINEISETSENDRGTSPDPVSKEKSTRIDQLLSQIKTPEIPKTFSFGGRVSFDGLPGGVVVDSSASNINGGNMSDVGAAGDEDNNSDDVQIHRPSSIQKAESSLPPPYVESEKKVYFEDNYNSDSSNDDEFTQDIPMMIMPSELLIYPAAKIMREDINSGDKVILSVDILMACEHKQLTYPMAFSFTNQSNNKMVNAGVLEFTSPEHNHAYLPQWMFEHLQIQEGQYVNFEHVELPKGTFVQLQPVSSAWLGVPYDKRMAIMEFQLRNFQTLTEGTKVTITYELNRYIFKVLRCKPGKGISIVDADLTTDVVEPADFNRFHSVEEGQAENVSMDEAIHCVTLTGQYRHFVLLSLPGRELPHNLKVEVKCESGDPDLFLCQTCSTPSQSRYTWCSQDVGDINTVLNTSVNKSYDVQKSLFCGVVSLSEDASFVITFHSEQVTNDSTGGGSGHVLRSATGSSDVLEQDDGDEVKSKEISIPPGHGQCSYCDSVMPQLKLLMHERHCAQSTYRCNICKQCYPKSFEKKHHHITHQLLTCDCGEQYSQLALHNHQIYECIKRSVKCPFKWCQLSFPLDQMETHESRCGRKLVACPICSEEVSQLELEMHLEAFHLVEVDKLNWDIPISSQSFTFKPQEPAFKCHCGTTFEFEDDLQVHQLTECSPIPPNPDEVVG